MPLYGEIRTLIGDLYEGRLDTESFRDKFVPMLLMSGSAGDETDRLALAVENLFAAFTDNLVKESELRDRLLELVPRERFFQKNLVSAPPTFIQFQLTLNPPVAVNPIDAQTVSGSRPQVAAPLELHPAT